jgi:hypothetical protein
MSVATVVVQILQVVPTQQRVTTIQQQVVMIQVVSMVTLYVLKTRTLSADQMKLQKHLVMLHWMEIVNSAQNQYGVTQ